MMPGLYVFAAVGIVAGALGFVGGWQVQGWRLGEQIADLKSQQAEAVNKFNICGVVGNAVVGGVWLLYSHKFGRNKLGTSSKRPQFRNKRRNYI